MRGLDVSESIDALSKAMLEVVKLFYGGCHGCLGSGGVGGFRSHATGRGVGGKGIRNKNVLIRHEKSILMSDHGSQSTR